MPVYCFIVAVLLLGGCGFGTDSLEQADPRAAPLRVTYTADIAPRMNFYCTQCHGSSGQIRNAGDWNFETFDNVSGAFATIRRVAIDERSMPPGGARKLTPHDQLLLLRWEAFGFPQ